MHVACKECMCGLQNIAMHDWLPRKCDYRTDIHTDRQTPGKVIPMCGYALKATQKLDAPQIPFRRHRKVNQMWITDGQTSWIHKPTLKHADESPIYIGRNWFWNHLWWPSKIFKFGRGAQCPPNSSDLRTCRTFSWKVQCVHFCTVSDCPVWSWFCWILFICTRYSNF